MADQPKPETVEEIAKRFAEWMSTPEGVEALRTALENIFKAAAELQSERQLDAQAVERPVTV